MIMNPKQTKGENIECVSENKSFSVFSQKEDIFDQKKNFVKIKAYGHDLDINEKYKFVRLIGQGGSGIIVELEENEENGENKKNHYALKKIQNVFEHKTKALRALREIKILRLLNHENIISIKTVFLPENKMAMNDIYFITELMDHDLAELIRSPIEFTDDIIKFIIYQLLRGIKYVHSAKIIHRDLKPHNILISSQCDLKICDFGSIKALTPDLNGNAHSYTDYVTTRWYRAPELILSKKKYGVEVDMWSIGCIFAEMFLRRPLFTGSNTREQLALIIDALGSPAEEEIEKIENERASKLIKSFPLKQTGRFDILFRKTDPLALDLLKKMIVFDPSKRITAEKALKHCYLEEFNEDSDEPICEGINPLELEYEKINLNKNDLKDLLFEELLLYHSSEKLEEHKTKLAQGKSIFEKFADLKLNSSKDENSDISDSEI